MNADYATDIFLSKKILVCRKCGFGFLNSYIEQSKLNKFYADEYRNKTVHRKKNSFLSLLHFLIERKIALRPLSQLVTVKMFIDSDKVINILDIGAGYGNTFDAAKIVFPESKGYAFEPDKSVQRILESKNVTIIPESFLPSANYDYMSCQFDIIILSHVLEHYNADDVISVVNKLSGLLSANGVLLIEVPHADFRRSSYFRNSHAPHLSFFSPQSLAYVLQKAGLKIVFLNTCGDKEEVASEDKRPGFFGMVYHNTKGIPGFGRLYSVFRRMRRCKRQTVAEVLEDLNFSYCGNRKVIRAVVMKDASCLLSIDNL